jgi:modulator of FtsH protease HflC
MRPSSCRAIDGDRFRRGQEIQGTTDTKSTRIYGEAYNRAPEFYSFSRTLEGYKESKNENSVAILTTKGDYYRYLKKAGSGLSSTDAGKNSPLHGK